MKRIIPLALTALFIISILAACGSEVVASDPVGMYYIETINGKSVEDYLKDMLAGISIDPDEYLSIAGVSSFSEFITLELKDDGTAVFSSSDEPESGRWEQDGNKLTITIDGDAMEMTLNGSELTFKDGSQEYVFKK